VNNPIKTDIDLFEEFGRAATVQTEGLGLRATRLEFPQIVDATSPHWKTLILADYNHGNAPAFDSFLKSDGVLQSLRRAGVEHFFEEIDAGTAENYSRLRSNKMTDVEFSESTHITSWVENHQDYETQSYIPFVKEAARNGIQVHPADLHQAFDREHNMTLDIYYELYIESLDESFSSQDKIRLMELFPVSLDENSSFSSRDISQHDKNLVERFLKNTEHMPDRVRPDFSSEDIALMQDNNLSANTQRQKTAYEIAEAFQTTIRIGMDPDVSQSINQLSTDSKSVIRYGLGHAAHANGFVENLDGSSLLVGVYKNTQEYAHSLQENWGQPHLVYLLDTGRTYGTEATPPEILKSIEIKENDISASLPKVDSRQNQSAPQVTP
jgi:hypothetical protein